MLQLRRVSRCRVVLRSSRIRTAEAGVDTAVRPDIIFRGGTRDHEFTHSAVTFSRRMILSRLVLAYPARHHICSSQHPGEYGPFDSDFIRVEGTITDINGVILTWPLPSR